jgi:hypothetical protein
LGAQSRACVSHLAANNDLTEAIIYFEVSRSDAAAVERFKSASSPVI